MFGWHLIGTNSPLLASSILSSSWSLLVDSWSLQLSFGHIQAIGFEFSSFIAFAELYFLPAQCGGRLPSGVISKEIWTGSMGFIKGYKCIDSANDGLSSLHIA